MEKVILNNGVEMPILGFGVFQITNELECNLVFVKLLKVVIDSLIQQPIMEMKKQLVEVSKKVELIEKNFLLRQNYGFKM